MSPYSIRIDTGDARSIAPEKALQQSGITVASGPARVNPLYTSGDRPDPGGWMGPKSGARGMELDRRLEHPARSNLIREASVSPTNALLRIGHGILHK